MFVIIVEIMETSKIPTHIWTSGGKRGKRDKSILYNLKSIKLNCIKYRLLKYIIKYSLKK
jgi:hypothetical protein